MADKGTESPRFENISGLAHDFSMRLVERMHSLTPGTAFEDVWPGDRRTFMLVGRHRLTISEIARVRHTTRQAAHNSILRLVEHGLVKLKAAPGSRRDKTPVLTKKGLIAERQAARNIDVLEDEIAAKIGKRRLEELRRTLLELVTD